MKVSVTKNPKIKFTYLHIIKFLLASPKKKKKKKSQLLQKYPKHPQSEQ